MPLTDSIRFEECSIEHCDVLHQIALQTYNEHYTGIWHDQGKAYLERFYTKSLFQRELQNGSCKYYLIYDASTVIGFIKLQKNALHPHNADECLELNKIYILKAYTGRGIGRRAFQFVMSIAVAENVNVIWVNVMSESNARKFYEDLGFQWCHEVALDYPHMKAGLNILSTYKLQLPKFQTNYP